MKKLYITFLSLFVMLSATAQNYDELEGFREKFTEANYLMEDKLYSTALPIWLDLHEKEPENANINYKVGVCYLNSNNEKKKALPYLQTAVQNTNRNYNPFSHTEESAPVSAKYYMARAYHLDYNFDKAIMYFSEFKKDITEKHYLYDGIDRQIAMCEYGKEAVKDPVNIEVNNLGGAINSKYAEYSPVLSVDESAMYFTSRRMRPDSSNRYLIDDADGKFFEDIYVSYKVNGIWEEPELLNINTSGHEATLNLSADGRTLFIYKDDDGNGNLYYSNLKENELWSEPKGFESDINKKSYETHAAVSPDGDILYFVSDRKGGLGGKDIYFCKKLPTGDWALAQNAGSVLNTPYDEDGIFIHPDGKTLYFSSKGHNSIGGYDIMYSTKDDQGNWSKPENLGYPINSTDDDVFFVTSTDGRRGYYSSFQKSGYGEKDIYMIELTDAEEKALTLLIGYLSVHDKEDLPEDARITITDNNTGQRVGIYRPRKRDGKFTIIIQPGSDYHLTYEAGGYTQEEDIYVPPASAYQEINKAIELRPVQFGEKTDDQVADKGDENQEEEEENQTADKGQDTGKEDDTTGPDEDTVVDVDRSAAKGDVPDDNISSSLAEGNTYFQQYFDYNHKDVDQQSKKFADFMKRIKDIIAKEGNVEIAIQSSASKVPTRTFSSNATLAAKRANDAQATMEKVLKKYGIDKSKVKFKDFAMLVQGPEYNHDHIKNKNTYVKYQYVRITAD